MSTPDDFGELLEQLQGRDIDGAQAAAKALAAAECREAIPALLHVVRTTEHRSVRNAVAIALSDLGEPRTVAVLADLLVDPRTKGCRGSLLYALEPFDTIQLIEVLVDHVIDGNYEKRTHALSNIEMIEGYIDNEVLYACTARLSAALEREVVEVYREFRIHQSSA